jgi:hypothetical protein
MKLKHTLSFVFLMSAFLGIIFWGLASSRGGESFGRSAAAQADKLLSLGYLTVTDIDEADRGKSNVTLYAGSPYEGVNMYCDNGGDTAYFMDMRGNVLHSVSNREYGHCMLLKAYNETNILWLDEGRSIVSLDFDSNVVWESKSKFHHDFDAADDGRIYALTERAVNATDKWPYTPFLDQCLVVLSPGGEITKELCFSELISKNDSLRKLLKDGMGDIFHVNTLSLIRRDVYDDGRLMFRRGDILACIRNMDTIVVVDLEREEIKWFWGGGVLEQPHQPVLEDDGRILVFDNGVRRNYSRILEVSPATGQVTWEYAADPPNSFFSTNMGGIQALPNGNILVTESQKGHVFEISREGGIVWDFWEPPIDNGNRRRTIYRMTRLPAGFGGLRVDETPAPRNVTDLNRVSMCDRVDDEGNAFECLRRVGIQSGNTTMCDMIADGKKADSCYEGVSVLLRNQSMCELIKDRDGGDGCRRVHAIIAKDGLDCEKVMNPRARERCFGTVGVRSGEPHLCELISNADDRDWCYGESAFKLKNATLCEMAHDPLKRDMCYVRTAKATGNASLCNNIVNAQRIEECTLNAAPGGEPPPMPPAAL